MSALEQLITILISRIDPVATYLATDIDETSNPKYYGFMNKDGFWYITRMDSSGTVRYASYATTGIKDYITCWGNRVSLVYQYPKDTEIK